MKYVTIDGAKAVISVSGKFDLCKIVDVLSELDTAYQNGCTKVQVDFAATSFIDSSVIRDLVKTRHKVRPENFSAKNADGVVLAALKAAKLDEWLKNDKD